MREFFNAILAFIVADSLTDIEFATTTAVMPIYDQESYDNLSAILASRENISTMQDRLLSYYTAKGVSLTAAKTHNSEIFIGAVL